MGTYRLVLASVTAGPGATYPPGRGLWNPFFALRACQLENRGPLSLITAEDTHEQETKCRILRSAINFWQKPKEAEKKCLTPTNRSVTRRAFQGSKSRRRVECRYPWEERFGVVAAMGDNRKFWEEQGEAWKPLNEKKKKEKKEPNLEAGATEDAPLVV